MKLDAKFWTAQLIFQLIFGLSIFGITRAYYVRQGLPEVPPARMAQAPRPASPAPAPIEDPLRLADQADEWFTAGDYRRAAEAYDRLLQMDPDNPEFHNNLGLTLQYLGRSDDALAILERGTAADASYQRLWLTLGFVRAARGDYPGAGTALRRAVNLGADNGVGQEAQRMLDQLPQ